MIKSGDSLFGTSLLVKNNTFKNGVSNYFPVLLIRGTIQFKENVYQVLRNEYLSDSFLDLQGEANLIEITNEEISLLSATASKPILSTVIRISGDENKVDIAGIRLRNSFLEKFIVIYNNQLSITLSFLQHSEIKTAFTSSFILLVRGPEDNLNSPMQFLISNSQFEFSASGYSEFMLILAPCSISLENITISTHFQISRTMVLFDHAISNTFTTILMKNLKIKALHKYSNKFEECYSQANSPLLTIFSGVKTISMKQVIIGLGITAHESVFYFRNVANIMIKNSAFSYNVFCSRSSRQVLSGSLMRIVYQENPPENSSIGLFYSNIEYMEGSSGSVMNILIISPTVKVNVTIARSVLRFLRARQSYPFLLCNRRDLLLVNFSKNFLFDVRSQFAVESTDIAGIYNLNNARRLFDSNILAFANFSENLVHMISKSDFYDAQTYNFSLRHFISKNISLFEIKNDAELVDDCYFNIIATNGRNMHLFRTIEFESFVKQAKGGLILPEYKLNLIYQDGQICVNKITFISAKGGNTFIFNLTSTSISQHLQEATVADSPQEIRFSFDITCGPGNKFDADNFICIPCPRGTFSNTVNIYDLNLDCQFCESRLSFYCYGENKRSPKPGFYRHSFNSSRFLKCPRKSSCLGDVFYSTILEESVQGTILTEIKKEQSNLFSGFYSGLCRNGYAGALCAECQEGYGITDRYTCARCDNWFVYFRQFLILLIRLLLFWYELHKIFKFGKLLKTSGNNLDNELKQNANVSYLIKITKDHFQIIMLMLSIPLPVPDDLISFLNVFTVVNSPNIDNVFSFDCFLKRFSTNSINSTTLSLVLLIALDVFTIIFYTLIFHFLISKSKRLFLKEVAVIVPRILIYILMTNIIGQVQPFLFQLFCIEISDPAKTGLSETRLMIDLRVNCAKPAHKLLQSYFAIPMVLFVGLLMPIILNVKLRRIAKRGLLADPHQLEKYGYFYFQYDNKFYFYELFTYIRRVAVLFLQIMLTISILEQEILYVNVLFLVVFLYTAALLFLQRTSPYKSHFKRLGKFELFSFRILLLTVFSGIVWLGQIEEPSLSLSLFLLFFTCILNILFILAIVAEYFAYSKEKLVALLNFLIRKFPRLGVLKKKILGVNATLNQTFSSLFMGKDSWLKLEEIQQLELRKAKKEIKMLRKLVTLLEKEAFLIKSAYESASKNLQDVSPGPNGNQSFIESHMSIPDERERPEDNMIRSNQAKQIINKEESRTKNEENDKDQIPCFSIGQLQIKDKKLFGTSFSKLTFNVIPTEGFIKLLTDDKTWRPKTCSIFLSKEHTIIPFVLQSESEKPLFSTDKNMFKLLIRSTRLRDSEEILVKLKISVELENEKVQYLEEHINIADTVFRNEEKSTLYFKKYTN